MFLIDFDVPNRCFQSTCFHRFDGHDPRLKSAKLIDSVTKILFRLNEILSYKLLDTISIKASIQTCQIRKVIEQYSAFSPTPGKKPVKK